MDPVIPYNAPSPLYPQPMQYPGRYDPYAMGGQNMWLQMAMNLAGGQLQQMLGGAPLGMSGMNPYNNIQRMVFDAQHREAIAQSVRGDLAAGMDIAKGMAAVSGINMSPGSDAERIALQMGRHVIQTGLALGPHGFAVASDFLTGGRGQGAMAAMTHLAGRTIVDPVTGRMGLSASSSADIAGQMYRDFGFTDPDAWRLNTRGLTSGQLGGLFAETSRRGMLSIESGPGVGIDTGKIKSQLENYTKAVAAVREIFGDANRSNAPMHELLGALETMTQGASFQLQPGRTEMMVRNMYITANRAGIGMAGLGMMLSGAGAQTQALGLQAPWGPQAALEAMQYQLGMASAGTLSNPGWGMPSPEKLTAMHMGIRTRNAASPMGNRIGALLRAAGTYGLSGRGGARVQAWLNQIRSGRMPAELVDGMSDNQFIDAVTAATGRSQEDIYAMLDESTRNEEALFDGGAGVSNALMHASRRELVTTWMRPHMGARAASIVRGAVGKLGAGNERLSNMLQQSMESTLLNSPNTVLGNTAARNKAAALEAIKRLQRMAANGDTAAQAMLSKYSGSAIGLEGEMTAAMASLYDTSEASLRREGILSPGELLAPKLAAAADPAASAAAARHAASADIEATIGSNMAGEITPNMLQRVIQSVASAGYDPKKANLKSVLGDMFNIRGNEAMLAKVEQMYAPLEASYRAWEKKRNAAMGAKTPEEFEAAWSAAQTQMDATKDHMEKWQEFLKSNKLLKETVEEGAPGEGGGSGDMSFTIGELSLNVSGFTLGKWTAASGKGAGRRGSVEGR